MKNILKSLKIFNTINPNYNLLNKFVNLLIFLTLGVIIASTISIYSENKVEQSRDRLDEIISTNDTLNLVNQRIETLIANLLSFEELDETLYHPYFQVAADGDPVVLKKLNYHLKYNLMLRPQEINFILLSIISEIEKFNPINTFEKLLGKDRLAVSSFDNISILHNGEDQGRETSYLGDRLGILKYFNKQIKASFGDRFSEYSFDLDLEKPQPLNGSFKDGTKFKIDLLEKMLNYTNSLENERNSLSVNYSSLSNIKYIQYKKGIKLHFELSKYIEYLMSLNTQSMRMEKTNINFFNNLSSLVFFYTFLFQMFIYLIFQIFEINSERRPKIE